MCFLLNWNMDKLATLCLLSLTTATYTKYPDINDLFNMEMAPEFDLDQKPADVIVKNISIDLEKLDMSQFHKKMNVYSAKLSINNTEDSMKKNSSEEFLRKYNLDLKLLEDPLWKEIEARSLYDDHFSRFEDQNTTSAIDLNKTRRQSWIFYWTQAATASRFQVRIKILELMLQTIYMARYRIKKLESDRFFNAHDTSFRIGFLHKRLRRMLKRLTDILTMMQRKKDDWKNDKWEHIGPFVILHHKAARVHVDFLYLFRTMMRLHETYEIAQHFPQTIPVQHRVNISYWPPTTARYRQGGGLLDRITPSRPGPQG